MVESATNRPQIGATDLESAGETEQLLGVPRAAQCSKLWAAWTLLPAVIVLLLLLALQGKVGIVLPHCQVGAPSRPLTPPCPARLNTQGRAALAGKAQGHSSESLLKGLHHSAGCSLAVLTA